MRTQYFLVAVLLFAVGGCDVSDVDTVDVEFDFSEAYALGVFAPDGGGDPRGRSRGLRHTPQF